MLQHLGLVHLQLRNERPEPREFGELACFQEPQASIPLYDVREANCSREECLVGAVGRGGVERPTLLHGNDARFCTVYNATLLGAEHWRNGPPSGYRRVVALECEYPSRKAHWPFTDDMIAGDPS